MGVSAKVPESFAFGVCITPPPTARAAQACILLRRRAEPPECLRPLVALPQTTRIQPDGNHSTMASFAPVGLPIPRRLTTQGSGSPRASTAASNSRKTASTSKATNSVCVVCSNRVIDGKDETLFYEGNCQGWSHRCCVGVSSHYFQCLTSSDSPFLCIICTQERNAATVASLNDTISELNL